MISYLYRIRGVDKQNRNPPRAKLGEEWSSAQHHRHVAAVLGPAALVRAERDRAFLAVAERGDAPCRDTARGEIVLGGVGAAIAQREIILARAALVAMALDR